MAELAVAAVASPSKVTSSDMTEQVLQLVDAFIPHFTESRWDGDDPKFATVIQEAFLDLESKVEETTTGQAGKDDGSLEAAGEACANVLKDRPY